MCPIMIGKYCIYIYVIVIMKPWCYDFDPLYSYWNVGKTISCSPPIWIDGFNPTQKLLNCGCFTIALLLYAHYFGFCIVFFWVHWGSKNIHLPTTHGRLKSENCDLRKDLGVSNSLLFSINYPWWSKMTNNWNHQLEVKWVLFTFTLWR